MTNAYHFVTRWRIRAPREVVYEILSDPLSYPRWWPSVYLSVTEVTPGAPDGIGRRFRLLTKGWLPYRLDWEAVTTEADAPRRLAIRALGDFDGHGIWTLEQRAGYVDVAFDWKLTAQKPLLRRLSFVFKPVFSANHRWAMDQGRKSLEREVALRLTRLAAMSPEAVHRVNGPC